MKLYMRSKEKVHRRQKKGGNSMAVDFIVMLIIAALVIAAIWYIRSQKKKGVTCIGCPHAGECAKRKQGGCGTGGM